VGHDQVNQSAYDNVCGVLLRVDLLGDIPALA